MNSIASKTATVPGFRTRCTQLIALGFVGLSAGGARATNVSVAAVESRYFTASQQSNADYWPEYLPKHKLYWQGWLQAYRAIAATPILARRFTASRPNLGDYNADLAQQLSKLGLTPKQVARQPTHLYTLHIASYRKKESLDWFLRHTWLSRRLERRRVYENEPKKFRLFLKPAEVMAKHDPLYVEHAAIGKATVTRVLYGVYENVNDANRDRRVLENRLNLRLQILRRPLIESLISNVWLKPVEGRYFGADE